VLLIFSKHTCENIDNNTNAVALEMFVRAGLRCLIYNKDNAFFVTIMHPVGLFYQYRYVKEQLTAILATLFDL